MKAVPVALFLGAVSLLAGCRHVARVHVALPPNPQVIKDARYFQSVVKTLPDYIADEKNARFEQEEIERVEDDVVDIYEKVDVESDDAFHQQVQKLSKDVGQLEAKDKYLEANRLL